MWVSDREWWLGWWWTWCCLVGDHSGHRFGAVDQSCGHESTGRFERKFSCQRMCAGQGVDLVGEFCCRGWPAGRVERQRPLDQVAPRA